MKEHDIRKEFKCNRCDSQFFLEWGLNRHLRGHDEVNRKFYHYFNNGKLCPFDESGCKFKHEDSEICIYGQDCTNLLCQYQHNPNINDVDKKVNSKEKHTKADEVNVELKHEFDKAYQNMKIMKVDLENKTEKLDTVHLQLIFN